MYLKVIGLSEKKSDKKRMQTLQFCFCKCKLTHRDEAGHWLPGAGAGAWTGHAAVTGVSRKNFGADGCVHRPHGGSGFTAAYVYFTCTLLCDNSISMEVLNIKNLNNKN